MVLSGVPEHTAGPGTGCFYNIFISIHLSFPSRFQSWRMQWARVGIWVIDTPSQAEHERGCMDDRYTLKEFYWVLWKIEMQSCKKLSLHLSHQTDMFCFQNIFCFWSSQTARSLVAGVWCKESSCNNNDNNKEVITNIASNSPTRNN